MHQRAHLHFDYDSSSASVLLDQNKNLKFKSSGRIKTEFKTLNWILFTATAVQITSISVLANWASSDENGFFWF